MAINLEHQACPHCNNALDRCGTLDPSKERNPAKGDLTLCFYCAALLVFNSDLKVEPITDDIWRKMIVNHPIETNEILRAQNLIKEKMQFYPK